MSGALRRSGAAGGRGVPVLLNSRHAFSDGVNERVASRGAPPGQRAFASAPLLRAAVGAATQRAASAGRMQRGVDRCTSDRVSPHAPCPQPSLYRAQGSADAVAASDGPAARACKPATPYLGVTTAAVAPCDSIWFLF